MKKSENGLTQDGNARHKERMEGAENGLTKGKNEKGEKGGRKGTKKDLTQDRNARRHKKGRTGKRVKQKTTNYVSKSITKRCLIKEDFQGRNEGPRKRVTTKASINITISPVRVPEMLSW